MTKFNLENLEQIINLISLESNISSQDSTINAFYHSEPVILQQEPLVDKFLEQICNIY